MKKYYSITLYAYLLSILLFPALQGDNPSQPFTPSPAENFVSQLVSIILDDTEQEPPRSYEAMAQELWAALVNEGCTIIVNSSVVKNVIQLTHQKITPLDDENEKLKITFNPKNWIKKRVTPYLYVLIPAKNLSKLQYTNTKKLPSDAPYTQAELITGFKIDHMENMDDNFFMNPTNHAGVHSYEKNDIDIAHHLLEQFSLKVVQQHTVTEQNKDGIPITKKIPVTTYHSTIFISNDEYYNAIRPQNESDFKKLESLIPRYALLLNGHGSPSKFRKQQQVHQVGHIANLTPQDFGKLLGFFAKKLNVKLLFVQTCYGSGVNLSHALEQTQKDVMQQPNFIIITGAMSNAATSAAIETDGYQMTHPNFKKFFTTLARESTPSEATLWNALKNIYELYGTDNNNIPHIKYPHLPWRIMDIPQKSQKVPAIVSIDTILAQTRDPQNPLDISHFFKRGAKPLYPQIIALKATNIPFKLILSKDPKGSPTQPPHVISNTAGDSLHNLESIEAPDFNISDVLKSFLTIKDLKENKVFSIKNLTALNNVLKNVKDKTLTVTDVIAFNKIGSDVEKTAQRIVFFTHNKKPWKFDFHDNTIKETTQQEITRTLQELKNLLQQKNSDQNLVNTIQKLQETIEMKAVAGPQETDSQKTPMNPPNPQKMLGDLARAFVSLT